MPPYQTKTIQNNLPHQPGAVLSPQQLAIASTQADQIPQANWQPAFQAPNVNSTPVLVGNNQLHRKWPIAWVVYLLVFLAIIGGSFSIVFGLLHEDKPATSTAIQQATPKKATSAVKPTTAQKQPTTQKPTVASKKVKQPVATTIEKKTPQHLPGVTTTPYNGSLPSTVPVYAYGDWNYYYAGSRQYVTASGVSVRLGQAQPIVQQPSGAQNHSVIELAVQSTDGQQIVEVGWIVDQILNGDSLPHLFVYHWVSGQTSCYNACGFVQTSSTIYPGQAVTVGASGDYQISYSSGNWNIYYNDAQVGYYPGSLWSGAFTQVGYTQVFGEAEIDNSSTTKCVQMGNGLAGTNPGSTKISNFTLINSSTKPALSPFSTVPSTYTYGSASATSLNIGGPGVC